MITKVVNLASAIVLVSVLDIVAMIVNPIVSHRQILPLY